MIAISNLAFPATGATEMLSRLAQQGLAGVEVAPTRIAPWDALDDAMLAAHRAKLAEVGLSIPSLQAILFGVDGAALLGEPEAFERMREHLRRVARIANILWAGVAVFGSPRQRSLGELAPEPAFALGAERFRDLAEAVWAEGRLVLGLEPVPPAYGGDFLTTWQECLAMVRAVDHPGLRLHLDTGCVLLGGGAIAEAVSAGAPWLAHFHAAEPQLGSFGAPVADHVAAAEALIGAGYTGWVSIEMREAPEWAADVPRALAWVQETYREPCTRHE